MNLDHFISISEKKGESYMKNELERRIGNSLYRICKDEKNDSWYIVEFYKTVTTWATGKAYYGYDIKEAITALNGFIKEREIAKPGLVIGGHGIGDVIDVLDFIREYEAAKPGHEAAIMSAKDNAEEGRQTEQPSTNPQEENTSINKKGRKEKPMTVSPELFKQLIFDIVIESQGQMTEDVANALLDVIRRFDIGNPWISMECGKPASGEYFFIRLKESAGYTDPYWRKPMLAKRVKGGFHVAGRPFADSEVESYSEVCMPR